MVGFKIGRSLAQRRALGTSRLELLRFHLRQVRVPRAARRVFKRHSKTTLEAAHILENSENLANVTSILEANPNVLADISARVSESGRQHIGTSAKTRRVQRMLWAEDEAAVPVRPALAKANCPRKTTYGCPEVHDTHTEVCIQKARPQDGDWMGAADPPYRIR